MSIFNMGKVIVVILNYKLKELVLECLESVYKSSYKDFEVVVVDNNSGDGMEESLIKFPKVDFIQTGDNLGYSGGNNIGVKAALSKGAEYVFVLNPDTTVKVDTIFRLVEGIKRDEADVVGPKIYFHGGKVIWYAGGQFDMKNVIGKHRGVDEIDRGQFDKDVETDFVTGAAMMVKREVFEKNGFFDDRYFLYYEDADFCMRAKKAGFGVYYIPEAVVYHQNAKSTGLGSPLQDYFTTRNRLLFAFKFLPWRTRLALLREALRHSKLSSRRMALRDFLTGNLGKGSFIK